MFGENEEIIDPSVVDRKAHTHKISSNFIYCEILN